MSEICDQEARHRSGRKDHVRLMNRRQSRFAVHICEHLEVCAAVFARIKLGTAAPTRLLGNRDRRLRGGTGIGLSWPGDPA